ncbi:OprO/OprP family phosphate-selective porin [Qipengyuania nanhaisediminis]|uniref:OprO/OprP family phosphate-selective porin n=1 Tax=Qipengyuania nanhaisediminis TaxID=604088 RepID=UPI0038B31D08
MKPSISKLALVTALVAASSPLVAQDSDTLREELAAMRAEMQAMAERVDALEAELDAAEAEASAASAQAEAATAAAQAARAEASAAIAADEAGDGTRTAFKGAPEVSTESGWSFKPRGRLQYDAGTIAAPDGTGIDTGFGSEARRARLGVSGDMPGGFGYKFEVDFAGNDIAVADAIVSYETGNTEFAVGQFNNFQSLEELTSSLHTSFIERAAFTDAFGFERRVGAGVTYAAGDVMVQAGGFSDNMEDLSNKNWSLDGRIVFHPEIGDTRLHLGGSVHYADLERGSQVRYRQRPLVHFTSDRLVNTGRFDAASEFGLGLEAAVIAGPFHAVAEGYWQMVEDPFGGPDAGFFGGYAEVGYFLTEGDSRGYKGGKFDRTKPENPVGEGGSGSVQVNLRYDRLDLNDGAIIGGTQDGYYASIVWKPTDYTALLANYGRLEYSDAAFATASGSRDYGVDVVAIRAQVDF